MKKLFITTLFLLSLSAIFAQKEDFQFVFGKTFNSGSNTEIYQAYLFDFSSYPFTKKLINNTYTTNGTGGSPTSAICDKDGKLQSIYMPFSIKNSSYEVMQNGNQINHYGSQDPPYSLTFKNALMLHHPSDDSIVYLFTLYTPMSAGNLFFENLVYARINIKTNNGKGKVEAKNIPLLQNRNLEQFSAIRHANGRDWWLIVPDGITSRYDRFLIDPSGIHHLINQYQGFSDSLLVFTHNFSPNGEKYAFISTRFNYGIYLYEQ
jgi:hypothetical protein